MRYLNLLLILLALPAAAQEEWPTLSGPYLGQEPPGTTPAVFAPGLITGGNFLIQFLHCFTLPKNFMLWRT